MTTPEGTTTSADRSGAFLETLSRLTVDDLAVLALPEPDPDERTALLARAITVAEDAGRLDEVRVAPERAREAIVQAFSFRAYEPTWFGRNWAAPSVGRTTGRDRWRRLKTQRSPRSWPISCPRTTLPQCASRSSASRRWREPHQPRTR